MHFNNPSMPKHKHMKNTESAINMLTIHGAKCKVSSEYPETDLCNDSNKFADSKYEPKQKYLPGTFYGYKTLIRGIKLQ